MKDLSIIGGGLVGLGTAYALARRDPSLRITLIEKEPALGRHQSTHNSGVLHAGLYYAPGSLKARLAVQGIRQMRAFCAEHGVAHETCGKLVVAVDESELPRLRTLLERGTANGLTGLQWLWPDAAHAIEPHVKCVAAVHVPEEGIADYASVVRALEKELIACGVTILRGAPVRGISSGANRRADLPVQDIERRSDGWTITLGGSRGAELRADFLINCAGLHADRVAVMAGEDPGCLVVPFRGEYFTLRPEAQHLVRNLIYPVPDPAFPFLGVHFTRLVTGGVECGPNAVLALAREGYRFSTINARDALESLTFGGLWRFVKRYPRMAWFEVARSLSKPLFTRTLQRLIPELTEADLARGGSGVRAQAMLRDGTIVQDFLFVERENAFHVLNAASPAATASLAIGEEIAGRVLKEGT